MKIRKFENLNISRGFTMIELLIVIAVLGILAVAVLAAINPIEQINRGRDTGHRSDAEQLIGGVDRFYTFSEHYPWTANADEPQARPWLELTSGSPILQNLSNTGASELKASFVTRVTQPNTRHLFIFNNGGEAESTYVCFLPQSGAFRIEAEERCAGTLPTDLAPVNGQVCAAGSAYSCLP